MTRFSRACAQAQAKAMRAQIRTAAVFRRQPASPPPERKREEGWWEDPGFWLTMALGLLVVAAMALALAGRLA